MDNFESAYEQAYSAKRNQSMASDPRNWSVNQGMKAQGRFNTPTTIDIPGVWEKAKDIYGSIQSGFQSLGQRDPVSPAPNPTPTPQSNIIGDPSQMKITYGKITPTPTPISTPAPALPMPIKSTPQTTPQPIINDWTPKYANLYRPYIQQGVTPETVKLIVTSENGKENPNYVSPVNPNGTVDVGLMQVSVSANNTQEIERLKNPEYNIQRGMAIWNQRMQLLEDPILALASYNMGSGGAVLAPEQALQRAIKLYSDAGLQMPETEFTKNPLGYVRARMDRYKKLGLFRA